MCYRSDRGFTLIEVLVSLTILAMITGVAFAGLGIGIDSWQRGTRRIEELDRRFSVERLVQRQLALAVPGLFEGSGNQVEFISNYSLVNGTSDPVVVQYSFDAGRLSYNETPLPQYTPESTTPTISQILGDFSQIQFRYLATDRQGQMSWLTDWNVEGVPSVVEVRIGEDILIIPTVNNR